METPDIADDPVLVARAKWSRVAVTGRRIGFVAMLLALAAFVVAVALDYPTFWIRVVTVLLIVGSIILGPSIILGYMVRAAQQDDPGIQPN